MNTTYTQGTAIPTTGASGGWSALLNTNATTATAVVEFWRYPGTTAAVSLAAGIVLPVKVKSVVSSSQILTGLN